eukprot:scaffold2179_cov165-Amphora_coffeaeformis.AAC.8
MTDIRVAKQPATYRLYHMFTWDSSRLDRSSLVCHPSTEPHNFTPTALFDSFWRKPSLAKDIDPPNKQPW